MGPSLRASRKPPKNSPYRETGGAPRDLQHLWDRVGASARRATAAALLFYRRLLSREIRTLIPEGLRRAAKRSLGIKDPIVRVYELRVRLSDLGFVERALSDLNDMSESSDAVERQLAIWELAVWHANRRSSEGSAAALALLDRGIEDNADPELQRREAVLRAECHATLGDFEAGRSVVADALAAGPHPDLHLAAANLHAAPSERLVHINRALGLYQLPGVSLGSEKGGEVYDTLAVTETLPAADGPKISVVVPAFNAAEHIATALEALIAQTWKNLEVLVVDDCSTDATAEVVLSFSARDPRIRLIRAQANRGSYVARNIALGEATGDFVTTHDSDDWSHPRKLEIQARHLVENRRAAGNMSQQARTTGELVFHRRGNAGHYIFDNMSSLMFRREMVLHRLGCWDSVRFGADSEFIERIRLAFGRSSVVSLSDAGPLSFQRQSDASLTGSSVFGFHGFFMGARRAYHQASRGYHRARRYRYAFPQEKRPFAVPEPMRPVREVAKGQRRAFDTILVSDFRLPGSLCTHNLMQIEKAKRAGHRIGLIQLARYDFDPTAQILPEFRNMEDRGEVHFLVAGERVSTDRLIVLHAQVLEEFQRFVPDVETKQVEVQVVMADAQVDLLTREALGDWLDRCKENAKRYFGQCGEWSCENDKLQAAVEELCAD